MDKQTKNGRYIIGIDEVGRGPIAGPVAVGAFICKKEFFDSIEIDTPLRDSKKLSAKQREKWFVYLKECREKELCNFAVSYVSSENIDKFGIVKAIQKALDASLNKITKQDGGNPNRVGAPEERVKRENFLHPARTTVYLDGGLKAPVEYINQETVVKGDELHPVISCASIVAKVSRDRVMANYAKEYPLYGFENHMGYGTRAHYEAIKKHGQTVLHRKSFLKNIS
ncbi:MAG: ribonuclease HII [Patescibacteria group bacterium]